MAVILVDQRPENPRVGGSIPSLGTIKNKDIALTATSFFYAWKKNVTSL